MFNIKVKTFYDTEQIQIYSKPQKSKGDVYKKVIDRDTGEIFPPKSKLKKVRMDDGTIYEGRFVDEFTRKEDTIRRSCSRTVKAIYDIARCDAWEWFVTFTFNGEKVARYDYGACTKKLSYWLNNMRKQFPDMKYIVVPEQHEDGAFHFHGLFKNVDGFDFSGHFDKKGRKVYNWISYKWGWTTATMIDDYRKASAYLCKYITKELCSVTEGKKRYWASRNVNRPIVEERLIDGEYLNLALLECMQDDAFVKSIESEFVNVIYVDQSIPQTRTCLSKMNMSKNNIDFDTDTESKIK